MPARRLRSRKCKFLAHGTPVQYHPVVHLQLSLLGRDQPRFDPDLGGLARTELTAGAWVDYLPGWVRGHAQLFEELERTADWRSETRVMYERTVEVPRLTASYQPGRDHPVVAELSAALGARYRIGLERITMALYRDGRDSVAWHGDRNGRDLPRCIVGIVSLGEPRRFLMRPKGGGESLAFQVGWGDLLVMGGTAQRTWEHGVPKVKHAGPRLSIMFRHGDQPAPE
jgi:alkylated DNA repair dioxygenase AlkB